MSEPKLITPLLADHLMGDPISNHHGVQCCPALHKETQGKYIVKILSIPATSVQLDALLLSGAFSNKESALEYFKELSDGIVEEAEKVMLISIDSESSLDELAGLAETAGAVVISRVLQNRAKPDPGMFIGTGKAEELALMCQAQEIDLAIVDEEITGAQQKNLEKALGVRVIDRTALILRNIDKVYCWVSTNFRIDEFCVWFYSCLNIFDVVHVNEC